MDNDNVFSLVPGGAAKEDGLPSNRYVLEDIDGHEYGAEGFLIFTAQHIAVMRDIGKGAIPVLVMPLTQLKVAEIYEDDEAEAELPF